MGVIIVTDRSGHTLDATIGEGESVMEAIRRAGVDELLALCGGCCSCATCHVYVDPGLADELAPMSEDENDLLESAAERRDTSRLACQIAFTPALECLRVTIAPE